MSGRNYWEHARFLPLVERTGYFENTCSLWQLTYACEGWLLNLLFRNWKMGGSTEMAMMA